MRLQRQRGRGAQHGRRVVPDLVEQRLALADATLERVHQPSLAVEAVLDVLGELRVRIPHDRAVARAERLELAARAGAAATRGSAPASRRPGGMKTLPSPSTVSPQNSTSPARKRDVIGRVTGRRDHLERPDRVAVRQHDVQLEPVAPRLLEPLRRRRLRPGDDRRARSARASTGAASAWSRWRCVSTIAARLPPARLAASSTRST